MYSAFCKMSSEIMYSITIRLNLNSETVAQICTSPVLTLILSDLKYRMKSVICT